MHITFISELSSICFHIYNNVLIRYIIIIYLQDDRYYKNIIVYIMIKKSIMKVINPTFTAFIKEGVLCNYYTAYVTYI